MKPQGIPDILFILLFAVAFRLVAYPLFEPPTDPVTPRETQETLQAPQETL
jgi:hypothetical protein